MLKHLDLFSGIGGFSLGLESSGLCETAAFCDWEPYCQKVLKKHWPHVPVYGNIKELNYERLKADGIKDIDIITGGYPCQPFSVAGRKKGEQDERHLWPEYLRLIQELRPSFVIGENVGGHVKLGLDTVLTDLASEGYATTTFSISASSIGANHQRERIWIIAYSNDLGRYDWIHNREGRPIPNNQEWNLTQSEQEWHRRVNRARETGETLENTRCELWPWSFEQGKNEDEARERHADQPERSSGSPETDVAHSESCEGNVNETNSGNGEQSKEMLFGERGSFPTGETWWSTEPDVGRVADGVPQRVDRLKCLGNSVVPMIPYLIGRSILELYEF
jgi:DNA (cytosine-5)-methyltransferase 1